MHIVIGLCIQLYAYPGKRGGITHMHTIVCIPTKLYWIVRQRHAYNCMDTMYGVGFYIKCCTGKWVRARLSGTRVCIPRYNRMHTPVTGTIVPGTLGMAYWYAYAYNCMHSGTRSRLVHHSTNCRWSYNCMANPIIGYAYNCSLQIQFCMDTGTGTLVPMSGWVATVHLYLYPTRNTGTCR